MFKKLSVHRFKSAHNLSRDSLIDPNANMDYKDVYLESNTMEGKSVKQMVDYSTNEHHNYFVEGYHQEKKKKIGTKKPLTPEAEIEALVHEGISYHERGQLEKATQLFRLGAEKGNPIGMFLYGVSLRHGWGCKKNEHTAFQYLQKAAEHAVEDLANITSTVNTSASKGELIMAIYELGVSFRHGWGCKKNKESAVQFFKIAADLGDPDAQNDLGHCYYQGQGVKKDLHMAAKYYRKADKQGQGIMGNSWIWKSKYDDK
ncbi:hypothetical protein EDC96DRAFT_53932 [Choanephora cucurbitarum]|nr:hypothetical protein EDC96DRAFT_53932 [Choanephora cucurbitarum]